MNNNGTIYVHDRNLSYGEAEKKISTQRLHGTFVNAGNGKYICISGTKFDGTLYLRLHVYTVPRYCSYYRSVGENYSDKKPEVKRYTCCVYVYHILYISVHVPVWYMCIYNIQVLPVVQYRYTGTVHLCVVPVVPCR